MQAHVVPRVYLKGFAHAKRGLGVYNSELGKPAYFERDVKHVATQQDFYILYGSDGTPNEAIEDALSKLEATLRATLKRLRGGKCLTADDLSQLAVFAAMQEARSERRRNVMATPLTVLRNRLVNELKAEGHSAEQTEAAINLFFRKHLASGDLRPDPNNISLLMVPEGVYIRYQFFSRMSMCIVESAAHDFFTCDDPVAWTETFQPPKEFGFDYLSISAEVTYPLTRRHSIVFSYFPLRPRAKADQQMVSIINARTAGNALREVYAHLATARSS
jgi:hypothetical protein